jgi:hypothetical protein
MLPTRHKAAPPKPQKIFNALVNGPVAGFQEKKTMITPHISQLLTGGCLPCFPCFILKSPLLLGAYLEYPANSKDLKMSGNVAKQRLESIDIQIHTH